MRVLVHIERSLDEPPTLEELASIAYFSPHHFHHLFSAHVGESVAAYTRRVRLERAAARLVHTEDPIPKIGRDAGFESVEGFGRAFKSSFDISPAAFRTTLADDWVARPEALDEEFLRNRISARIQVPVAGETPVEITRFASCRVAALRHVGPYHRVGLAWARLMVWATIRGHMKKTTRCIGISYDDPGSIAPKDLRYDACIMVEKAFKPRGKISTIEIPEMECAVARHTGPYEGLASTYEYLFGTWLPSSGREPADFPSFCEHPKPRKGEPKLTLVHVPLADAG